MSDRDSPVAVVGLTGGIATGKTAVAALFEEWGVPVLDADTVAREVVSEGRPAYREIVGEFGEEILAEDGSIDRDRLGEIVFSDPDARQRLESITHPRIVRRTRELVGKLGERGEAWCLYEAPLLYETGSDAWVDAVVVTRTDRATQIDRLVARDGLERAEAKRRIESQMPLSEKAKRADYVLDTGGTREDTEQRARELFEQLRDHYGAEEPRR